MAWYNDSKREHRTGQQPGKVARQFEQPTLNAEAVDKRCRDVGSNKLVREVIKAVHAYGPIRADQLLDVIHSVGIGNTIDHSFIQRMSEQGFLAELELQKGWGSAYVLGNTGRCYMLWRMGRRSLPIDRVAMYSPRYSRLDHDVLIADVIVPLMLDIRSLGGKVEWYSAERSPDRGNHYGARWDAYVKGELQGLSFSFVFEADRGTEQESEIKAKVRKYDDYLSRGTWQNALDCSDSLPILVVTTGNEPRLQNMRGAIASGLAEIEYAREQNWVITTVERLDMAAAEGIANPLIAPVWDSPYNEATWLPVLPCTAPMERAIQSAQAALTRYATVSVEQRAEATRELRQLRRIVAGLQDRSQLQTINFQAKRKRIAR